MRTTVGKFGIFLWCCLIFHLDFMGQSDSMLRCGFNPIFESEKSLFPDFEFKVEALNQRYQRYLQARPEAHGQRSNCDILVIPVVVHVIYEDSASNIPDSQIYSQIEVLNEDYRRQFGTSGYGIGSDIGIQFCLASKDPNGQPTPGITRTQSIFTNHSLNNDGILKSIINWNDTMYLNIWVVKRIIDNAGKTVLGYASFPENPNPIADGVVIQGKNFGRAGTVEAPFDQGRTATHEIGHFLGLYHTFETEGSCDGGSESNCASSGDFICDTPSEQDPLFGCPANALNSCLDSPCDKVDLLTNYMNFTDDACMDHFTSGQALRMQFILVTQRANLVSPVNLFLTGCDTAGIIQSRPESSFVADATTICVGDMIQFFELAEGCVDAFNWTFPGGTPLNSTLEAPMVLYSQAGMYPVSLTVSSGGNNHTTTFNNYIQVTDTQHIPPYYEGFEGIEFVPSGWKKEDEDGKGSWIRTTFAASEGIASVVMPNFTTESCGSFEDLITSAVDLREATAASLRFEYAYKARNMDANRADILEVFISDNCGQTFDFRIFKKQGINLATVPGFEDEFVFIPLNPSDWKNVVIPLTNFLGNEHIRVRFRGISRRGQHLFLDNIRVTAIVSVEEELRLDAGIRIFPNPFSNSLNLEIKPGYPTHASIMIYDLHGKIIQENYYSSLAPEINQIHLQGNDIEALGQGVYFVRITTDRATVTRKIVK